MQSQICLGWAGINWRVVISIYHISDHLPSYQNSRDSLDYRRLDIVRIDTEVPYPFKRPLGNPIVPSRKCIGDHITPTQMDPHTRNKFNH